MWTISRCSRVALVDSDISPDRYGHPGQERAKSRRMPARNSRSLLQMAFFPRIVHACAPVHTHAQQRRRNATRCAGSPRTLISCQREACCGTPVSRRPLTLYSSPGPRIFFFRQAVAATVSNRLATGCEDKEREERIRGKKKRGKKKRKKGTRASSTTREEPATKQGRVFRKCLGINASIRGTLGLRHSGGMWGFGAIGER